MRIVRLFVAPVALALALAGCSSTMAGTAATPGAVASGGPAGISAPPGGTAGAEELAEHNWLDEQGRLYFAEAEPDDALQATICDYLVGTLEQVTQYALDGANGVTLSQGSGYQVQGGSGSGFGCGYDVDGEPVFAIRVWSSPLDDEDSDETAHLVTVELPNGLYGASAYHEDWDGATLPDGTAREWLTQIGGRIHR